MGRITLAELDLWRRNGFSHRLIDVRRAEKRASDGDEVPAGRWLDPAKWLDWKDSIGAEQPVILYCSQGHEISQGLAAALRAMGRDARHLDGGISAWREGGHPVQSLG